MPKKKQNRLQRNLGRLGKLQLAIYDAIFATCYTIRSSELQGKSSLFISNSKHHALKFLFVAMGKPLPIETAARASVAQLASQN